MNPETIEARPVPSCCTLLLKVIKLPRCPCFTTLLIIACAVTARPVATTNHIAKNTITIEKGRTGKLVMIQTIPNENNTDHENTRSFPTLSEYRPNANAAMKDDTPPKKYIRGVRSLE